MASLLYRATALLYLFWPRRPEADPPPAAEPPRTPRPASHRPQFDDAVQQRDAAELGMWIFLATEVLLFGGLFLLYGVYRWSFPAAFAGGSRYMEIRLGTLNTAILIASSFTMVLSVHAARHGRRGLLVGMLLLTLLLGGAFLGVKGFEWLEKLRDHLWPGPSFVYPGPQAGPARIFFSLYFVMTGLHALHLLIGMALVAVIGLLATPGRYTPDYHTPVEAVGLYWHFVDIIWIFLYPLFYLLGRT